MMPDTNIYYSKPSSYCCPPFTVCPELTKPFSLSTTFMHTFVGIWSQFLGRTKKRPSKAFTSACIRILHCTVSPRSVRDKALSALALCGRGMSGLQITAVSTPVGTELEKPVKLQYFRVQVKARLVTYLLPQLHAR